MVKKLGSTDATLAKFLKKMKKIRFQKGVETETFQKLEDCVETQIEYLLEMHACRITSFVGLDTQFPTNMRK